MSKIIYTSQEKYLKSFRIEDDELILEMEKFAKENKVPILNWSAAEFLESLILIHQTQRVLEIGTAIGYSTIRIAGKLKKNGIIDTIEKSKDNIKLAKGYIKRSRLKSKINLIDGNAIEIMPNIKEKYDFIFLDADKEDYKELFYLSLQLLKKKGILFVDNLLWQGYAASKSVPAVYKNSTKKIREFNRLFMNEHMLNSNIFPIGDGIGIGIKES